MSEPTKSLTKDLESSSAKEKWAKNAKRRLTYTDNNFDSLPTTKNNLVERKRRIIERRGVFKWMPALFSNDLVHGAWYYVAGCFLGALIPLFPFINLFQHEAFWPKSNYLPVVSVNFNIDIFILDTVKDFLITMYLKLFRR